MSEKVWIVVERPDFEDSVILGVFSSKEKATRFKNVVQRQQSIFERIERFIEEWDVQ